MSYVFDTFWCSVLDLVISTYFLSNILMGQCLIYINLCTFHVKKNSARLQWYSCARYKAPGPLVILFISGVNLFLKSIYLYLFTNVKLLKYSYLTKLLKFKVWEKKLDSFFNPEVSWRPFSLILVRFYFLFFGTNQ